jgi:hypothetical protein
METIIFRFFGVLFRMVGVLLLGGILVTFLIDMQKKAFDSHHQGLLSMSHINEQLVGKTKWLSEKKH